MSASPQFIDQEAKAREDKARYDHYNRIPGTVEDALAVLSERGFGDPRTMALALDGDPKTEHFLPTTDSLRSPSEVAAYNLLIGERRANTKPVVTPDPKYNLPSPTDPSLTLRTLTAAGPMAVAQFQREHPDDFKRLERVENNRMARSGRPLP